MKKIFLVLGMIFTMGWIFTGTGYAKCGGSHAILNNAPTVCDIQGLNQTAKGSIDPSVRGQIMGLGSGIVVCTQPNGVPEDQCTTMSGPPIDITTYCAVGSAWLNGDWGNGDVPPGCESYSEDGIYPAVTALVMEQLSTTGTPQYLAFSVDEGENGSPSSYFFDPPGATMGATFANLPVTDVTAAVPNGNNMDITVSWTGSSYQNRTGLIQTNVPNSECGTTATAVACEHLIYGYRLAYKYTNYTGGSCQAPTDFNISSGGWTVDSTIRAAGCLGGTDCSTVGGPHTISIDRTVCDTGTGTNCCVMVGVVNVYNAGDNNTTGTQPPTTTLNGWYTGGSSDIVKLDTSVLGAYIRNLQGVLEQMRNQVYVNLSWNSVVEDGVVGYKVHRACTSEGPWQVITSTPIPNNGRPGSLYSYRDYNPGCAKTRKAYYRVEVLLSVGNSVLHNEVAMVPLVSSSPKRKPAPAIGRSTRPKGN